VKKFITTCLFICLASLSFTAFARNDVSKFSVKDALNPQSDYVQKADLGNQVTFYFGNQKHPKILKTFGTARTHRSTNAFGKTDDRACQWALLSGLKALRAAALRDGGNAVVNIHSFYNKQSVNSRSQYICSAGAFVAHVGLTGTVVKIRG